MKRFDRRNGSGGGRSPITQSHSPELNRCYVQHVRSSSSTRARLHLAPTGCCCCCARFSSASRSGCNSFLRSSLIALIASPWGNVLFVLFCLLLANMSWIVWATAPSCRVASRRVASHHVTRRQLLTRLLFFISQATVNNNRTCQRDNDRQNDLVNNGSQVVQIDQPVTCLFQRTKCVNDDEGASF